MSASSLISDAQRYAEAAKADADDAMGRLNDQIFKAFESSAPVEYVAATLPNVPKPTAIKVPVITPATLDLPEKPGAAPQYQDVSDIDTTGAPADTAKKPELQFPDKPAAIRDFSDKPSDIKTDFKFPEPPPELMKPKFEAPETSDVELPDRPAIEAALAAITNKGKAPTADPKAPEDLEARTKAAYADQAGSTRAAIDAYVNAQLAKLDPSYAAQMAKIDARLAELLGPNATGLKAGVEDAIYERARSKNSAEARRTRGAAFIEAASRGFTLPSGAMLASIQQSRQAAADNNAAAIREIVVMQAELEQKNLQWAVATSIGLRTSLLNTTMAYMQHLVNINGQALDYAKTVLGGIVETYNLHIKHYSAQLDLYKTEVAVYEAELRSVLTRIEVYKGELAGAQLRVDVDKAKVDRYKAQLDSLNSLASAFRAQIDAIVSQAGLEKLKIDIFGLQVKAFEADVQAKNAEWNGFSSLISGEKSKADLYQAEIASFSAKSAAYKSKLDAQIAVRASTAATNDARAKQYLAEYSGYEAGIRAESAVTNANIESNRQVMNEFRGEIATELAKAEAELKVFQTDAQIRLEQASKDMEAKIQNVKKDVAKGQAMAQAGVEVGRVYASMASAAMSGMVSLAAEVKYE